MSLIKKLAWVGAAAAATVSIVYLWFFEIYAEHYFPGRYELAFRAFVYSALMGVVALAATAVVHLLGRRRSQ
jgi:hypothetical protein